jgi:nucleoside-diphosphate-sugar epimerase
MRVFLAGGTGVIGRALVPCAASRPATVAALDRGAPGTYNVVDDDPAMVHEWLPAYADAVDARPPRRVPRFIARLVAGKFGLYMTTQLQGATNAKAKRELGWQPRWASWRDGFREALG